MLYSNLEVISFCYLTNKISLLDKKENENEGESSHSCFLSHTFKSGWHWGQVDRLAGQNTKEEHSHPLLYCSFYYLKLRTSRLEVKKYKLGYVGGKWFCSSYAGGDCRDRMVEKRNVSPSSSCSDDDGWKGKGK